MKKRIIAAIMTICLLATLSALFSTMAFAEDGPVEEEPPIVRTLEAHDYDEFISALAESQEGETITITGTIQIPANSNLYVEGKSVVLRRGSPTACFVLEYDNSGGFVTMFSDLTFDAAEVQSPCSYVQISHLVRFVNVHFINSCCDTGNGGAVSVYNGNTEFLNCIFDNNRSEFGGHLGISGKSAAVIKDCLFTNGNAINSGGAIHLGNADSSCSIAKSSFSDNKSGNVGGALCGTGDMSIEKTKFYGNTSVSGGSDIAFEPAGHLRLYDNLETLTSLFKDDGLVPLGWGYDYEDSVIAPLPGENGFTHYIQLRLKFDNSTSEPLPEPEPTPEPEPKPDPTPSPEPDPEPSPDPTPGPSTEPTQDPDPTNPPSGSSNPPTSTTSPEPSVTPEITEETNPRSRLICGKAILDPSRQDYLLGYGDGLAGQETPIKRSQAVTVIFRLLTPESLNKVYSESGTFLDMSKDDWCAEFANTLQNAGVVKGCGGDMFRPERNLTQAEMITLFTRFVELRTDQTIQLEHWSEEAVQTAASLGWLQYDDDFNPDKEVPVQEFLDFAAVVLEWAEN